MPSGGEGRALDEQGRRPRRAAKQSGLPGSEQHRLQGLAGPGDVGVVALGQQVVERVVLEIRCQESREPLRRQMDLLEQEWLATAQSESLDVQRGRARLELEGRCHRLTGRFRASRDQSRLRVQTAGLHLVGEAPGIREVAIDPRAEDVGAAALGPFDPLLARQLRQRAPDGDQAAAIAQRQFALRREAVAGLPVTGLEGRAQVEVDLVMQRDGADLETETCHSPGVPPLRLFGGCPLGSC